MQDTGIRQEVDVEAFVNNKVEIDCPRFEFYEGNDPLVVVYNNLTEGDIPLVFNTDGMRKTFPKRISGSAYNIQKLLKVLNVLYYYNEKGECFELRDVVDYLEAVVV